jgi:long-chain fatty acid transport protein
MSPMFKTLKTCAFGWLLIWSVVVQGPANVLADGVIRDGLGAISSGRGGTNIAHSDNGEILLDNPAAMVNIEGTHLSELSADVLFCDLHYSDPQNNTDAVFKPFPLAQLSYIKKSTDGQWAYGLGVFAPAGFGAEFDLAGPPPIGGTHRYKSLGALVKFLPGVACRLTDRLSVGGTLGVGVSHAELEGPFFLQTGALRGAPTLLDLQGTGAAVTWSLGMQHELSDKTTWGVTYTSETCFRLNGSVVADVYGLGPGPERGRFDAQTNIVWPRSVGLGVKHDLCKHRRLSADVVWYNWSRAFDSIDMRLTNSDNPLFNAVLGPTIRESFPLDWRDSVSVRLGFEQMLTPCSVFRAGYAYHENQIPSSTVTTFIPAILEHAVSIGYGRRSGQYSLDLAYQYSVGRDSTVTTSSIVGGDFDSSKVEAQAHWVFVSLSRQF